ncbi:MAG: hypothetical protein RIR36_1246, partial [Bacteroidota bacterium]
ATINSYRVYEYRGIPYAVPPTGNRRWSLPEPVTSLGPGVFKAYDFGSACPQNPRSGSPEKYVDEDCLSLNVTTPADMKPGERLPVFFWIHGGAFVGGSSNLYRLDKLAHEGRLVVVSINYRLGAFGFMPHPAFASNGYSGNYGLEDQRLAMKWVQQNIRARVYIGAMGLSLMIPALLLLGYSNSIVIVFAAASMFGFGFGMFDTNNMPILCQFVPSSSRATAYGLLNTAGIFAGAVITDYLGKSTDAGNLNRDFAALAGIVLVVIVLQLLFLKPKEATA